METLLSSEDFLFKERESVLKKLQFFINAGRDKLHLLLDFDRTLTLGQNELGENVTTWEILKTHLPQKAQLEYEQYYNNYRPLETEKQMTEADAIIWWERILNLYSENQLKWQDIKKDVSLKMPIRPFTKELFEACEKKNIPTIILSAGIKDIIDLWCQKFKIKPTLVLSTKLVFSPKGYMIGWERDSLIHVLNKKEKSHQEIEKIRSVKPNTILIGDSLDDILMVEGEDVLRIAVYNPRRDDKPDRLKDLTENFDLILQNGTLNGVIKILNLF